MSAFKMKCVSLSFTISFKQLWTWFEESPRVCTVNNDFVNRSPIGSVFVMFQTVFCSQIPFD